MIAQSSQPEPTTPAEVAPPEPSARLSAEIRRLPASQCVYASSEYQVWAALRRQMPALMNEIGRLREVSFRAVQEGTGKARDIDDFDDIYQQLFVWHGPSEQVLGAYRLCMTDLICREWGPEALYTKTLFDYDAGFLEALGPALELGRSFVRPEYQGAGRVLALLWRGIGRLLAARPRYRTLFGPVSISSAYADETRRLIAARLCSGKYRHPLFGSVAALRPVAPWDGAGGAADEDAHLLSRRVSELEPDDKGLPVLVREYVKLGGQFLAFSIDPDFRDAMDGLVAVDLDRTKPRLLSLYMGEENYQHFCRSEHARPAPTLQASP